MDLREVADLHHRCILKSAFAATNSGIPDWGPA